MHDEAIADARADQRTGNAAVVGPGVGANAGRDLDRRDPRVQVDFDDVGIGIQIGRLAKLQTRSQPGGCRLDGADAAYDDDAKTSADNMKSSRLNMYSCYIL